MGQGTVQAQRRRIEAPAILPVAELDPRQRAEMFSLLEKHFEGIETDTFERDLAEKDSVLLLRDDQGRLGGFSTLMRWTVGWQGSPAEVFFSGDTIVEPHLRASTELPRQWSRHVFALAARLAPTPCFWFLICSGFRTYRFLPVFFKEFYPAHDRKTPPEWQRLLDDLGHSKFGELYREGVVHLEAPLREGSSVRPDPHAEFFARVNPGHDRGHELACVTQLSPANLTASGHRMVFS